MKQMTKQLICKFGPAMASLALVFTTLGANSACFFFTYQSKLPTGADKLRKF